MRSSIKSPSKSSSDDAAELQLVPLAEPTHPSTSVARIMA